MSTKQAPIAGAQECTSPLGTWEERLERGEVLYFPICPFSLPQGDERRFLLEQKLAGRVHKNISYDPRCQKVAGFLKQSRAQADRLHVLFASFSKAASQWLAQSLPHYARAWKLDRVSFRPVEESNRKVRMTARNDLLHVDAFPSRPTNGHRILRLFANVNPTQPRIWVTSDPFGKLLERYGKKVGFPTYRGPSLWDQLCQGISRLFRTRQPRRSPYDSFMHRFHNFLKANREFQERGFKKHWAFPPGSAWMVLTDMCSHAALRGRFALEHSYFIAPESLVLPTESPPALLERACGAPVLQKAA